MRCIETHKKAVFIEVDISGIIHFNKRRIQFGECEESYAEGVWFRTWLVRDVDLGISVATLFEIDGRFVATRNETIVEGEDHIDPTIRLLVEDWDYGATFI